MKRFILPFALCLLSFGLTGCIDLAELDPGGYGGGGGGYYRHSETGYHAPQPRPYYGHSDYDRSHSYNRDSNYYGGSREWYKSGVGVGKKDRSQHESPNYRRHKKHYDGRTEGEFARGYMDGYNGRAH